MSGKIEVIIGCGLAGVALLAAACSDDRALGSDVRSGGRLKARYWTADSGAELLADWYDTELQVPCAPRLATDGVMRCLPANPNYAAAAVGPGPQFTQVTTYADDQCARPVRAWSACDTPAYLTSVQQDVCGLAGTQVFAVEGVATPTTLYRVDDDTGQCVRLGDPVAGAGYLYVGPELAPDTFVELTAEDGTAGRGRLRQRFYLGADGSRLPRDLYDRQLDTECALALDRDGALRCLPGATNLTYFADASCSQPMALYGQNDPSCEVPAPAYGRRTEMKQCRIQSRVYALRAPVAGVDIYWSGVSDTCEPYSLPPGVVGTFYGATADQELAPDTFIAVTQEAEASGPDGLGRLQPLRYRTDEGVFDTGGLWDRERDTACRPVDTADGQTRCLPPASGFAREVFSDPACTQAQPAAWVQFTECLPDSGTRFVLDYGEGCPRRVRIHELGASLDGSPLYEHDSTGQCAPIQYGFFYALGPELDLADFPALTLEQAD